MYLMYIIMYLYYLSIFLLKIHCAYIYIHYHYHTLLHPISTLHYSIVKGSLLLYYTASFLLPIYPLYYILLILQLNISNYIVSTYFTHPLSFLFTYACRLLVFIYSCLPFPTLPPYTYPTYLDF